VASHVTANSKTRRKAPWAFGRRPFTGAELGGPGGTGKANCVRRSRKGRNTWRGSCQSAGTETAVPGTRHRVSKDGSNLVNAPPAFGREGSIIRCVSDAIAKAIAPLREARRALREGMCIMPRVSGSERNRSDARATTMCRNRVGRSWRQRIAAPSLLGSASANCAGPWKALSPHEDA
jgi:hypothetical protein